MNDAIREVNVRIGCVDGIEYIPQKRMVEVNYLSFPSKREMQRGSIFTLQRSSGRAPSTTDLPKLFDEASLVPKGCVPAYTNKMCEVAIAEAKEHRQTLQSMFVGAPRHLVSVGGENSVDLAICVRLTKSDHATVDTVQARLATLVKSELYKFSALKWRRHSTTSL